MTVDIFFSLMSFAFVASITPGPNNMMIMASAANFGTQKSFAHLFGITFGCCVMIVLSAIGLMSVFEAVPAVVPFLQAMMLLYLVYLSWKIATAKRAQAGDCWRPMHFIEASAFQWVNPKAWMIAFTIVTLYTGDGSFLSVMITIIGFASVNLPAVTTWLFMGRYIQMVFQRDLYLQIFNIIMAVLLLISVLVPVVMG